MGFIKTDLYIYIRTIPRSLQQAFLCQYFRHVYSIFKQKLTCCRTNGSVWWRVLNHPAPCSGLSSVSALLYKNLLDVVVLITVVLLMYKYILLLKEFEASKDVYLDRAQTWTRWVNVYKRESSDSAGAYFWLINCRFSYTVSLFCFSLHQTGRVSAPPL